MTPSEELRALVVEDSRTQAAELEHLLGARGFDVRLAGTMEEALQRLAEQAPDVVLLDLELPDATGVEGLALLEARFAEVPVVVLTSRVGEECALDALGLGAEDYVQKDQLEPAHLARTLRYAIERHRTRAALVELSDALREKNAELEALAKAKDHLLGVVAHDLRNPLAVVRGYADFLSSGVAGPLTDEQADIVAIVRRTTDYMLQLVHDLVDFSRIQAGRMGLERTSVDLPALVREVVRMQGLLAQPKQIRIVTTAIDPLEPLLVDEHKVRQVLDNLLSNAIKFSHRGGEVEVSLVRVEGWARLCVRDAGVGIAAGELDQVFRPFRRGGARPTGGERSTGLGLAIVRNIVEAHGGRITVESVLREGSRFCVELPLEAPSS